MEKILRLLEEEIEKQKPCEFNNHCLIQAMGWRHSAKPYDCSNKDSKNCENFYKLKNMN